MIDNYLPFVMMVIVTVASPGPGVLMTLDNTLSSGWRYSMYGVVGLALGAAVMAGLTVAGLGLLIRSSPTLFYLVKYGGIGYLFYLAYKTWHRVPRCQKASRQPEGVLDPLVINGTPWSLLAHGVLLQTSNPKSLLFFLSVLPQAVDGHGAPADATIRLAIAITTYCIALIAVHTAYVGLAHRARPWFDSPNTSRLVSRISATVFAAFGITILSVKF